MSNRAALRSTTSCWNHENRKANERLKASGIAQIFAGASERIKPLSELKRSDSSGPEGGVNVKSAYLH